MEIDRTYVDLGHTPETMFVLPSPSGMVFFCICGSKLEFGAGLIQLFSRSTPRPYEPRIRPKDDSFLYGFLFRVNRPNTKSLRGNRDYGMHDGINKITQTIIILLLNH